MKNILRPALVLLAVFTLVTGVLYPLVVTGAAHAIFPAQATGSFVTHDGKVIGSLLVGQSFDAPEYFWGRPSATAPNANNAAASGGANQGPLNPALIDAVKARVAKLRAADPGNTTPVPVDLVTASASGLDPHISPAAAHFQVDRVARAGNIDASRLRALVDASVEPSLFGFIGEPRVNVLQLNMALAALR